MIEKEVRSDEDEVELVETFAYKGDLRVLHETRDENNELVYREETKYDDQGRVLESETWSAEMGVSSRVQNDYDDKGELIGASSFTENGDLIFKVEYEREGDLIVGVREQSPEKTVQTKIEYDEKGNPVLQEERDNNGELHSRIERRFDEYGNVIESEAIIDTHGQGRNQHYLLKYEYEFHEGE